MAAQLKMDWDAKSIEKLLKDSNNWSFLLELTGKHPHLLDLRLSKWSETLVHWAALGNSSALIQFFSMGANLNVQDNQGRTPLEWGVEALFFEVQELTQTTECPSTLQETGVHIQKKVTELVTSIDLLLSYGAQPATPKGYDILDLLLHCGAWSLAFKVLDIVSLKASHMDSLIFGLKKHNLMQMEVDFVCLLHSLEKRLTNTDFSQRIALFYQENQLDEKSLNYIFSLKTGVFWDKVEVSTLSLEKQLQWEECCAGISSIPHM